MIIWFLLIYALPIAGSAIWVIATHWKNLGPMLDERELPGHQARGEYR